MSIDYKNSLSGTLSLAKKQLDDNYEGPKVKPVVKLPPLPAGLAYTLPPASGSRVIKLKSLRSPKFELTYAVPSQDSVFSLKERLLTDPDSPLSDGKHNINCVRLLIKARVISDTKQIAELSSEELSVVVSSVSNSDAFDVPLAGEVYFGNAAVETGTEPAPINSAPAGLKLTKQTYPGVNQEFWDEIEHVARKYVEDSQSLVTNLRKAYEKEEKEQTDEFDLD